MDLRAAARGPRCGGALLRGNRGRTARRTVGAVTSADMLALGPEVARGLRVRVYESLVDTGLLDGEPVERLGEGAGPREPAAGPARGGGTAGGTRRLGTAAGGTGPAVQLAVDPAQVLPGR